MSLETFATSYHTHIFLWLGIFILTLLLECFSKKTISLWFSVASIAGLLIAALRIEFKFQFIAFLVISIIFIIINECYFQKIDEKKKKEKIKMEKTAVEIILDENNEENVTLSYGDNEEVEFEQVAVVELDDDVYAVLHPVDEIEGINPDEILVFKIDVNTKDIELIDDEDIIDEVLEALD